MGVAFTFSGTNKLYLRVASLHLTGHIFISLAVGGLVGKHEQDTKMSDYLNRFIIRFAYQRCTAW